MGGVSVTFLPLMFVNILKNFDIENFPYFIASSTYPAYTYVLVGEKSSFSYCLVSTVSGRDF